MFASAAAGTAAATQKLTSKERVDRALAGRQVDRPPITFWYHFLLEKFPAERHAQATLDFHRRLRTDLVKVMSDYPYPKPAGDWWTAREEQNPFPEQIRALEIIRDGLDGKAHFVETLFNPWNVAEKLSSKEAVQRLKSERPQALLDALEAIAKSEANHAKRAVATGASGIFLAIANAQEGILTPQDYAKFSEPFDRMVLDAVGSAPINTLHLHGDKVHMNLFYKGWPVTAINYSTHATGVKIAEVRRACPGTIIGGLDEVRFREIGRPELKRQWQEAAKAAGAKFILAPGCSVPNETTDQELLRVTAMVGA